MKLQKREISAKIDFIYGTAWKEDLTQGCVLSALKAGYRAIDTANQRKHYFEEGVGRALAQAYAELGLQREDFFLQTKFTFARGQDHRKPYDENASFRKQVKQSFASSLEHLGTDHLDSFVLHGPYASIGLTAADRETWRSMEEICSERQTSFLGVSNVDLDQLAELHDFAEIKPAFVQNRCFAETRWDQEVRAFCREKGIHYQGFSLLTANWRFLGGQVLRPEGRNIPHLVFTEESRFHPELEKIIARTGRGVQQIVFRFAQQIGMIPITGTRSEEHMRADLTIRDFSLSAQELETLENIAFLA